MSRQRLFAHLLRYAGLSRAGLHAGAAHLPILAYHRVLEDDIAPHRLADADLFSVTESGFRAQLAWLTRHFDCLTFRQLPGYRGKRPLIITFDDGYEDNYRLAWPVLQQFQVPAVFFVTTDFIDHCQPLWFDRVAAAWRGGAVPLAWQRAGCPVQPESLAILLNWLKTLPHSLREQLLIELETPGTAVAEAPAPAMSWAQLAEMAATGMEIGSHSCSHAVLANESPADIRRELAESRARIEAQLGQPCLSLSYPVGGRQAVNQLVVDEAAAAGYQYACSYMAGRNRLPLRQPLWLRRIHVELGLTDAELQAALAFPRAFGYAHR